MTISRMMMMRRCVNHIDKARWALFGLTLISNQDDEASRGGQAAAGGEECKQQ